MNVFDLGVSPADSALTTGRRRLFNAVLIFGFAPNIPLLFIGSEGDGPPVTTLVVLAHVAVLCLLLFAQHRRIRMESVVCSGILWTLGYIVFLEWTIGRGRGGTGLVAWALVVLAHVMLLDSRGWLKGSTLAAVWMCASGLWFADAYVSGVETSVWLLRLAAFFAFPLIVLILLIWHRKSNRAVTEQAVAQTVEIEHLLRVAELGQVAAGVSHALAHPLQVATTHLELAAAGEQASDGPDAADPNLISARDAMLSLAAVVRQLDTHTGRDREASALSCTLSECLDHVRALTLSRVRHTNLTVDDSAVDGDVRLAVDRLTGTRLMFTLLACGSEFLRQHVRMDPQLSLVSGDADGQTSLSMHLGSVGANSADRRDRGFVAADGYEILSPLAELCEEKGWAWSASIGGSVAVIEVLLPRAEKDEALHAAAAR